MSPSKSRDRLSGRAQRHLGTGRGDVRALGASHGVRRGHSTRPVSTNSHADVEPAGRGGASDLPPALVYIVERCLQKSPTPASATWRAGRGASSARRKPARERRHPHTTQARCFEVAVVPARRLTPVQHSGERLDAEPPPPRVAPRKARRLLSAVLVRVDTRTNATALRASRGHPSSHRRAPGRSGTLQSAGDAGKRRALEPTSCG